MKLLHVIPYYIRATKTGGPASQLDKLAQSEQKLGHTVTIVSSTGNLDEDIDLKFTEDYFEAAENGVRTVYLNRDKRILPATFYYAPKLKKWLIDHVNGYDIVIIHGVWTWFSWIGPKICQKQKVPYLYFPHGCFDPWAFNRHKIKKYPYWKLIEKPNIQRAAGGIVLSDDEADQVRTVGITCPLFKAQNGLLFPLLQADDPEAVLNALLPERKDRPFVFFMARLHPKKGPAILLEAWCQCASQFPEWQLILAGPDEGGYLSTLQEMVKANNLEENVFFPGLVRGAFKAALLQKASIFVLPSYSEGVPGAVIEALGYGTPVLITPGCHLPEVADSEAGIIVEPEPQAIAGALQTLMADKNLRTKMGANAKNLAHSRFDELKVAERLIEFCKVLLKKLRKEA